MLPEIIAVLLGTFGSIIIQKIKQSVSSKQVRFLIALGLTGVTGIAAAFIFGEPFTFVNIIKFISVAFGASQVAYNTWKSLFVEG